LLSRSLGREAGPGFLHFFGLLCLGMPAALLAASAPECLYCPGVVLAW